jgi:hypothetical protein
MKRDQTSAIFASAKDRFVEVGTPQTNNHSRFSRPADGAFYQFGE